MKFNRDLFLTLYRDNFGSLRPAQADGLLFLLDQIERDSGWSRIEEVAYFLATVYWETAQTFQPIKERRGRTLTRQQQRYWPSGYYGRGYVQITWDFNYEASQKILNVPLLKEPDLALDPHVAYKIAAIGMRKGVFTGKRLAHYIGDKVKNYRGARRIINGTDKADLIASIATRVESILRKAQATDVTPALVEPQPDKPGPVPAPTSEPAPAIDTKDEAKGDPLDFTNVAVSRAGTLKAVAKRVALQVFGWLVTLWTTGIHGKILVICVVAAIVGGIGYEVWKHREWLKTNAKKLLSKLVKDETQSQ